MDQLVLAVDQRLLWEDFGAVPEVKPPVGREVAWSRRILKEATSYRAVMKLLSHLLGSL
jgi:hypothetical protein